MRKKLLLLLTVMLIALPGFSALKITLLNPKPNLALKTSKEKICLIFDSNVQDNFELPRGTIKKTKVSEWYASLTNGFNNGFGEFFTIVDDLSEADLILKLSKVDIDIAPAAYSDRMVMAVKSQINFRAHLINKEGEILKQCNNTAISKKAVSLPREIGPNTASALESMYEIIADEFFEK